ncbi:hypothetical protein IFM89_014509, partial [Coptis chinensis]
RKRSFRLAQFLVPFFESITEQVIPKDLFAVHSEIEGSNDMSSESDPFLAPTYESEDSADDIEANEQGERINVVIELANVPSPVNVRLLDENMSLTTTLPASRGENVEGGIASGRPQVEPEIRNVRKGNALSFDVVHLLGLLTVTEESRFIMRKGFAQDVSIAIGSTTLTTAAAPLSQPNVLVKKRSETIEQAAPISVDEVAGSTGCHPQSPPPIVTTVESTRDCGMDDGPMKKKPDMAKQREIQAIKAGPPNKTCMRRRPGHSSLNVTPGATLPLVSTTSDAGIFGIP